MANKRLSDEIIAARMIELRNLRTLHAHDRKQIRDLKAENVALRALVTEQQVVIETLKVQVAELQTMVFGKKRKPPKGTPTLQNDQAPQVKPPRTKDSFRRPSPPAHAVTGEKAVPIPDHCACGGAFTNVSTHERFEEDIPLPELTEGYQAHLVTKYVIARGVCAKCGKTTAGWNLGGQTVRLGPNVRLLMCHLVSVMGMSYSQVTSLLLSLYGLHVTDGEIALVLSKQHQAWLPAYESLKASIRSSPSVHADETPWAIQQNDGLGHAWSLSDSFSDKVCYFLENSRGAVHARKLFGEHFRGVRISDDYSVYRALPGIQQLCWAHLYRAIRDLTYNENLPREYRPYVNWWYEQFASIYQDLRIYLSQSYDRTSRETQSDQLWRRLQALLPASSHEPVKLTRLKAQLQRAGQDKLFACLTYNTPCDNNRAERDLRQLVLKRKRSFGSQTEKGARALSTILSICTTTWRSNPTGYFKALALVG